MYRNWSKKCPDLFKSDISVAVAGKDDIKLRDVRCAPKAGQNGSVAQNGTNQGAFSDQNETKCIEI